MDAGSSSYIKSFMKSELPDSSHAESAKSWHGIDWAVILLVALGAGLRLFQYFARASLWGDEISVVLNVSQRGVLDLVIHPLASDQMAPSGFVLCLKLMANFFGAGEYSLRFIPLLSSLVALPLFANFSRKFLSRPAMLLALGAFALSPPMIRYAAQVKPYSSDVAISLLCLLAALSYFEGESPKKARYLAAVGAAGVWFSYPAIFVVASIGFIVVARAAVRWYSRNDKHQRDSAGGAGAVLVLAMWIISVGALALLERHRLSTTTHSFMLAFWANWLMPHDLTLAAAISYLTRLGRDCLHYFLYLPKWWAFFVLLLIGAIHLVRRTQSGLLIIVPVISVLVASMLRIYPFSGRLILFLVPNLYVLIAAGIEAAISVALSLALGFANFSKNWRVPLQVGAFSIAAVAMCVWPLRALPPPYYNSETKPLISYLGQHRRSGDAIYVHNMAWGAYLFYGPEFGLTPDEAVETSPGPRPFVILNDLDRFRGRSRVWILFGGGYPVEASCTLKYLDSIGVRLDHQAAFNASVYLYDLTDRAGIKYRTADDFFSNSRFDTACANDMANPIGPQN
jgi:hypothetical protein